MVLMVEMDGTGAADCRGSIQIEMRRARRGHVRVVRLTWRGEGRDEVNSIQRELR
jgi:hypothetical protein